jgi:hypothetical protein
MAGLEGSALEGLLGHRLGMIRLYMHKYLVNMKLVLESVIDYPLLAW